MSSTTRFYTISRIRRLVVVVLSVGPHHSTALTRAVALIFAPLINAARSPFRPPPSYSPHVMISCTPLATPPPPPSKNQCIDIWMRDHVDCPYCRADINVWGRCGGGDCPSSRPSTAATAAAAAAASASAAAAAAATATSAGTAAAVNANRADHSTPLQEGAGGSAAVPGNRVRDGEGNWVLVGGPVGDGGQREAAPPPTGHRSWTARML